MPLRTIREVLPAGFYRCAGGRAERRRRRGVVGGAVKAAVGAGGTVEFGGTLKGGAVGNRWRVWAGAGTAGAAGAKFDDESKTPAADGKDRGEGV